MSSSFLFRATYLNEEFPPPFKNTYFIKISSVLDGLDVEYELKYLDRDTIDEDEIFLEGFTLDDDYSWKGKLNFEWKEYIEEFLKQSSFESYNPDSSSIVIVDLPEKDLSLVPTQIDRWAYILQELTQAIFEESRREAPLEITYVEISNGKKEESHLKVSFSDRKIILTIKKDDKISTTDLPWVDNKKILSTIYTPDYYTENASQKFPKKDGKYINIGDGGWYQFGLAAKNPSKKNNVLEQIEEIFKA